MKTKLPKNKKSNASRTAKAVGSGALVSRIWVVEMKDAFGRWTPCAEAQLTKRDCERVIRQYWITNNPDDSFRAKRYLG